jgi:hypothetical protein
MNDDLKSNSKRGVRIKSVNTPKLKYKTIGRYFLSGFLFEKYDINGTNPRKIDVYSKI